VFDYSYEDLAQIVEKSEANCRQIFARARQHIGGHQARYGASTEQREALLRSFLTAAHNGDLPQLVDLLTADAVMCADGGGKAPAIRQPLYGRNRVAACLIALFERVHQLGASVEPVLVNGGPGLIIHDPQGKIGSVFSFEVLDGMIQTVRGIANPDKLKHLGAVIGPAGSQRPDQDPSL
jgi:RNA polymerase sigma-70 factor (ECF subfamily)